MKISHCNQTNARRFFACVIFSCMPFLTQALANAHPADKEIILSFNTAGWPPYLINEEKGASSGGIMVDVLQAVASQHGYKIAVTPYPEKRGLLYLDEGKVDVFPKAKEWTKSPEKYIWTDPVLYSSDVLVFMRDKPLDYKSPGDFFSKQIGTVRGYIYPLFDSYFEDSRIFRDDAESEHQMLLKLLRHRYEVAIINKIVALWIIRNEPEFREQFEFSEKYVGSAAYRFMFTSKYDWGPFAEKFNQELKRMKADGRLEKILLRYR